MTPYQPVKLRALDAEDVQVIASIMQDAIAPVEEMAYRPEDKSFVMAVHRFIWDCGEGEKCFHRVHCAIDARGVQNPRFHGFSRSDGEKMLDLLTMGVEGGFLHLVFAGNAAIKLELGEDWSLLIADFGEPWPVSRKPEHSHISDAT